MKTAAHSVARLQLLQDMTLSCVARGRAGHPRLAPCVLVCRAWIEVTESELHDVHIYTRELRYGDSV